MSKDFKSYYKFGLYLQDNKQTISEGTSALDNKQTIYERIFSADNFNPVTRYSVDIRDYSKSVIKNLQKTLSVKDVNAVIVNKDVLKDRRNVLNSNMYRNVQDGIVRTKQIPEFKIGLYINDSPIIERVFSVYNYNPLTRMSVDLSDYLNEVTEEIETTIKRADENRMWEDYLIINHFNIDIKEVRSLSNQDRYKYLKRIG
jgi:hypothetical protein